MNKIPTMALDARQNPTDIATYQMRGHCTNCMVLVTGKFTKGHEAKNGRFGPPCPRCRCRTMLWDREVHRD